MRLENLENVVGYKTTTALRDNIPLFENLENVVEYKTDFDDSVDSSEFENL